MRLYWLRMFDRRVQLAECVKGESRLSSRVSVAGRRSGAVS